jgi:hypothetical protein
MVDARNFYWTPQTPLEACIHFTQDGFRSPIRNLQFGNVSKQFSNVSKLSPEVLVALSRSGGKTIVSIRVETHDFLEELSLKGKYNPLIHPFLCPNKHHGETVC